MYKDKGKIYELLEFKLWHAKAFSPLLNHDVISIVNKKQWHGASVRKEYGPFLFSLADDGQEREKNIKEAIRTICREYIASPANCAHGGVCKGRYRNG